MPRKTKLINVDSEAWGKVRQAFPNLSDSKRSKLLISNFDLGSFNAKLSPERTDTQQDIRLKRILRGLI